jgi:hypothetical protein
LDYKQELNIDAWSREARLATEFRKHGYTVHLPPVCLANENATISDFKEDCDFVVTKGRRTWKVMAKTIEALNNLDHSDDPAKVINSLQSLDLDPYKEKAWGKKGSRRLPTDPTWKEKFQKFCNQQEQPGWYGERLWAVSDQEVRTTFFFKGSDILKTNLKALYYGGLVWHFMPITPETKLWSSSYIPYLDEPWPQ